MNVIGWAALISAAFCLGYSNPSIDQFIHPENDRCLIIQDPINKDGYYIIWFEDVEDKKL